MENTINNEQNIESDQQPTRPVLVTGGSTSTLIGVNDYREKKTTFDNKSSPNFSVVAEDDEATIHDFEIGPDDLISSHEDDLDYPDGGFKAWTVVLGSFIGLIADFGYSNAIGAIETEISSTILKDTSSSTISWIFAIFMLFMYAGNILCGSFFDKHGSRLPMIAGTILMCGSIFITGNCTKVWHFILGFGVIGGIGSSLCMTPLIGVIGHWFLVNRATAIGIATTGGSVGGIIIPIMLRSLFPKVGFAWGMRILGFLCLACLVTSTLMIKERHKNTQAEASGSIKQYFKDLMDIKALADLKFLSVIGGLFMNELSLMTTLTYLSSYATAKGYPKANGMLLITIYNASGIPLRWLCGFLADKFGNFNLMAVTSLAVALLNFVLWYPFGSSITVLYLFAACYGFFSASVLTLNPVCCAQVSDIREFGKRYSTMYFFVAFGNLFGLPIGGAIIGKGDASHFDNLVIYIACLSTVGTVIWFYGRYAVGGLSLSKKV